MAVHHHGSIKDYFTEQLLTLLVCGLFGFVAIQLYLQNKLAGLLVPEFFPWVLAGGIAILAMALFRGIAVWKEAGEFKSQMQGDGTSAEAGCSDCNQFHIPGQEDYDHDHPGSNDLSWMFARMLIMFFPVGLFFLGLPDAKSFHIRDVGALSTESLKDLVKNATVEQEGTEADGVKFRILMTSTGLKIKETQKAGAEPSYEVMGGALVSVKFNELNDAAYDASKRDYFQGKTAVLEGHFVRVADKQFTIFRRKMTCCYADAVPLKVRIVVPQAVSGIGDSAWVQVKGQIQFLKAPGQEQYMPVLMVSDIKDVQEKPAPLNESE